MSPDHKYRNSKSIYCPPSVAIHKQRLLQTGDDCVKTLYYILRQRSRTNIKDEHAT